MSDERLVCEVEADVLRFHYAHHPESTWEVDLIDDVLVDARGYPITCVERALTEEEVGALVATHFAAIYRPREFTIDRTETTVSAVFFLVVGIVAGLGLYGFVSGLVL